MIRQTPLQTPLCQFLVQLQLQERQVTLHFHVWLLCSNLHDTTNSINGTPEVQVQMSVRWVTLHFHVWLSRCCDWEWCVPVLRPQCGMNSGLHIIIFDEIDAICKARGSVVSIFLCCGACCINNSSTGACMFIRVAWAMYRLSGEFLAGLLQWMHLFILLWSVLVALWSTQNCGQCW